MLILSVETREEEHEVIVTNVQQNPNDDYKNEKRAFQATPYRDWNRKAPCLQQICSKPKSVSDIDAKIICFLPVIKYSATYLFQVNDKNAMLMCYCYAGCVASQLTFTC